MQIFKLLIKKLFYTYYKIVKLHTGYKIKKIFKHQYYYLLLVQRLYY